MRRRNIPLRPRRSPGLAAFLVCMLFVMVARPSRADEAADRSAAEALYQLAQQLLKEQKYAEACAKLDASQALDPGVGTLLLLGDCEEKLGKLASAWTAFGQASSLAASRGDADRAQMADLRAAALRPRLVNVVYQKDPNNDVAGMEIRRDGSLIPQTSWGSSIPTDPGHYEIIVTAPDHESWRTTLDVPSSREDPVVVEVPILRSTPTNAEPTPGATEAAPMTSGDRPAPVGARQRTAGIAVFAAGAAALITSGVFAWLAVDRNAQSRDSCNREQPDLCSPNGVSLREEAQSLAAIATVLGVGGIAAMSTGTVLYVAAPRNETGTGVGWSLQLRARF